MEKNEQSSNAFKALQCEKSQHQFQDSEFLILTKRSKPHHRDPCSNIVPQREEVNDLRKKEKFLAVQDSQRVTWTSRNSCDVWGYLSLKNAMFNEIFSPWQQRVPQTTSLLPGQPCLLKCTWFGIELQLVSPTNFQLQVGWSIIQTCMHANGTNCGGLLELSCTVKISLTLVRKSLLDGLHHDAEICVLVFTNTFNDGDSKSDFAWKGRCQDIFDHSLGFCCRSHEDS